MRSPAPSWGGDRIPSKAIVPRPYAALLRSRDGDSGRERPDHYLAAAQIGHPASGRRCSKPPPSACWGARQRLIRGGGPLLRSEVRGSADPAGPQTAGPAQKPAQISAATSTAALMRACLLAAKVQALARLQRRADAANRATASPAGFFKRAVVSASPGSGLLTGGGSLQLSGLTSIRTDSGVATGCGGSPGRSGHR